MHVQCDRQMKHIIAFYGANRRYDQRHLSCAELRYTKNSSALDEPIKKFNLDTWRHELQGFVYLINNQTKSVSELKSGSQLLTNPWQVDCTTQHHAASPAPSPPPPFPGTK
jgi:hypothetical protein